MATRGRGGFAVLIFVLYCFVLGNTGDSPPEDIFDKGAVTISLESYNRTKSNGQAFTKNVTLPGNSGVIVNIKTVPPEVSFIVIQVHTHLLNVTLSYDKPWSISVSKDSVNGTNIGLVVTVNPLVYLPSSLMGRAVVVDNYNNGSVEALLAVVAYTVKAPIPGGCNMEFNVETSPFQRLIVTEATVIVDAQPASAPAVNGTEPSCERHPVQHQAYRLYLPEHDITPETYFSAIKTMLTAEDIAKNGVKIPAAAMGSTMRRIYSAYPGFGSVYGVVATYGGQSAAYVPAFTYACNDPVTPDTCPPSFTIMAKMVWAFMIFIGIYVTFFGSLLIIVLAFPMGIFYGVVISCLLLNTGSVAVILPIGLLCGVAASYVCKYRQMPFLMTFLVNGTLGLLMASILYYSTPDGFPLVSVNLSFWLTFLLMVVLHQLLIFVPFIRVSISCAVLGSYMVVVAIDYFVGSALKYIVINVIRRATVPNFDVAIITPPFQTNEICLTLFWIVIVVFRMYMQLKCFGPFGGTDMENSPLLHSEA
ncbi:transmembrane 7 superfamily member 3 [Orussus abietinus]|uniref:transmembrane 7 superfamily member 3 n=1 Tax=Orussus abietinus TaxID=222816 RepID=UPI0006260068|nr:transmembrane 7 superfamily member 3 [Orussus abietinus]